MKNENYNKIKILIIIRNVLRLIFTPILAGILFYVTIQYHSIILFVIWLLMLLFIIFLACVCSYFYRKVYCEEVNKFHKLKQVSNKDEQQIYKLNKLVGFWVNRLITSIDDNNYLLFWLFFIFLLGTGLYTINDFIYLINKSLMVNSLIVYTGIIFVLAVTLLTGSITSIARHKGAKDGGYVW